MSNNHSNDESGLNDVGRDIKRGRGRAGTDHRPEGDPTR